MCGRQPTLLKNGRGSSSFVGTISVSVDHEDLRQGSQHRGGRAPATGQCRMQADATHEEHARHVTRAPAPTTRTLWTLQRGKRRTPSRQPAFARQRPGRWGVGGVRRGPE